MLYYTFHVRRTAEGGEYRWEGGFATHAASVAMRQDWGICPSVSHEPTTSLTRTDYGETHIQMDWTSWVLEQHDYTRLSIQNDASHQSQTVSPPPHTQVHVFCCMTWTSTAHLCQR